MSEPKGLSVPSRRHAPDDFAGKGAISSEKGLISSRVGDSENASCSISSYNAARPHHSLGYKSLTEYRGQERTAVA